MLCWVIASTHRVVRRVVVLFCHFDAALSHHVFVVVTPRPIIRRVVDCCIPSPVALHRVVLTSHLVVHCVDPSCPIASPRVSSSHCIVMLHITLCLCHAMSRRSIVAMPHTIVRCLVDCCVPSCAMLHRGMSRCLVWHVVVLLCHVRR
jgi:hypothetical protein